MANVHLVRVHERSAVEEIITAATEIASEQADEERPWLVIFEKACDLLAARVPIVQPDGPLSLPQLGQRG